MLSLTILWCQFEECNLHAMLCIAFTEVVRFSVIPREPNVGMIIQHDPPSLVDEVYPLKLRITNLEGASISNVK